jgi:hypothetical protein
MTKDKTPAAEKKEKVKVHHTNKKKKKVLVPKWKLFRAKEPLISVFMWGVNHAVSFHHLHPV